MWHLANVGHPFVGLPKLDRRMTPEDALAQLEPFINARRHVPELVSLLLATQVKAGIACRNEDVLAVLSAEAWRTVGCLLIKRWRVLGNGIGEWDCTLRHADNPAVVFSGTAFEALIDHPDTYSGKDEEGPFRLSAVSQEFRRMGDYENALRQLRNAITLGILTLDNYPAELAMDSAELCDLIESDSLAAAVVRESVRVHRNSL